MQSTHLPTAAKQVIKKNSTNQTANLLFRSLNPSEVWEVGLGSLFWLRTVLCPQIATTTLALAVTAAVKSTRKQKGSCSGKSQANQSAFQLKGPASQTKSPASQTKPPASQTKLPASPPNPPASQIKRELLGSINIIKKTILEDPLNTVTFLPLNHLATVIKCMKMCQTMWINPLVKVWCQLGGLSVVVTLER